MCRAPRSIAPSSDRSRARPARAPRCSAVATRTTADPGIAADAGWRSHNLGALLFAATARSVRDKLRVMHADGFTISEAQLVLFHHLDHDGTRVTTIASRAGLTKQNMIELVNRAERLGLVGRRSDPVDRRAKIVHPTANGLELLATLERGITLVDKQVAQIVGKGFLAEMKHRLGAYATTAIEAASVPTGAAWRAQSTGRLMSMSARHFAGEALAVARGKGRHDIAEGLLALFRNLDLDGTRLTDIAIRARMTKQSMRELIDRAEALGFVGRYPDPGDRRAKIIRFEPSGLEMLEDLRDGIEQAEDAFRRAAGAAFTVRLKARLSGYAFQPQP